MRVTVMVGERQPSSGVATPNVTFEIPLNVHRSNQRNQGESAQHKVEKSLYAIGLVRTTSSMNLVGSGNQHREEESL